MPGPGQPLPDIHPYSSVIFLWGGGMLKKGKMPPKKLNETFDLFKYGGESWEMDFIHN